MTDERTYVFHIGEAYDDVRPAFQVDGRAYPDAASVTADLDAARGVLRRRGVLFEVETTMTAKPGVPSWAQWRQRHVVEGAPLPVRPSGGPAPDAAAAVQALRQELTVVHDWLRDAALALALTVPGRTAEPYVVTDRPPHRSGPDSADRWQEQYNTVVVVAAPLPEEALDDGLRHAFDHLVQDGWQPVGPATAHAGGLLPPEVAVDRVAPGGHTTCRVTLLTDRRDRVLVLSGRSLPRTPGRGAGGVG